MLWKILHTALPKNKEEIETILLSNRHIDNVELFFNPTHPEKLSLSDVKINPNETKVAVERILEAKENKETVLIYGDYDADGICATTVLWKTLHHLGINAVPFIPNREKHGYGISERALDDIKEINPDVIITVDNGIVAHDIFKKLKEEGFECILTDHHQPEKDTEGNDIFPEAKAVVHTTKLCGTTVAWMLAKEIDSVFASTLLDICAIASIADQVQMKDANRAFVYHGLLALQTTSRVGIKELCLIAGVEQKQINSYTVGFQLAPRINAMGRIAHGMDALRLLCTDSKKQAQSLAETLQLTNLNRQELTIDMYQDALIQAELQKEQNLIFVYSDQYHEGVIGLIAGKLTEIFYKPAIAVSISKKSAKASARSIAGVSIIEMLRAVRDDLLEVGGHPLAGGFSLEIDKVVVVKNRLHELARIVITPEQLTKQLELECVLSLSLISETLVKELQKFEPYGQGNPKPLFAIENAKIKSIQTIGKEGQHRKLMLVTAQPKGQLDTMIQIPALWWNVPEYFDYQIGQEISVAANLDLNVYKGRESVQLIVKDARNSTVT